MLPSDIRLNYPLNRESLVVDAGAYKGEFAQSCMAKWGCRVVAFEPCKRFHDELVGLSATHADNITVELEALRNVGLCSRNSGATLSVLDDSTSVFRHGSDKEPIELVDADFVMRELGQVDLLKLNIEGSEFAVLERLIATGSIDRVRFLLVQFHHIEPDCTPARRDAIREGLAKTHREMWCQPFIWESWERK